MLLSRPRRPLRAVVLATIILLLGLLAISRHNRKAQNHVLKTWYIKEVTQQLESDDYLQPAQKTDICSSHGFPVYPISSAKRTIYDLFLLSTELDWLEIRLNTLASYVDYFVIVESDKTFTGLPKPLYLKDNWEKFALFHDKIIHRIVEDPGESVGPRTWDHEDFLRNAMFDKVFPSLVGTSQEARRGDVLIVSDVDEIPKPEGLTLLRHCDFPSRLTLRSQFYYYSFQWLHRGSQWSHPQVTVYNGLEDTILPKDLRNGEGSNGFLWLGRIRTWWQKADLWDAAWHCSSCFATLEEMQKKMKSFSHVGWNTEANRDTKTIIHRVRNGLDLFGRETELYDRIDNNLDVPRHILQNRDKFQYLVDRDGANAGFVDGSI
ncbi:glycosyltransferase family 17 protein [Acrodontium crateriforme]|uniref:Glycosyltransferase family 17 protein n=1 Tax=Acrodontium crateriforme TaxID=150365 RepID=A0AAQ3MCA6_9PEZI|nr:glycosyltransferase family 17 protein [Acrodontium crateriforme]